mgnify:CR=1 FL=1
MPAPLCALLVAITSGFALFPQLAAEGAPSYTAAESPWGDPGYGRNIYDYYNALVEAQKKEVDIVTVV